MIQKVTLLLLQIFPLILLAQVAEPIKEQQEKIIISYNKQQPGSQGATKLPATPDKIWGRLFIDVQLKMALNDNKTFVDAVPKYAPEIILKKYQTLVKNRDTSAESVKAFIYQNFKVPVSTATAVPEKTGTLKAHLESLWPMLTRKADVKEKYSSLLPLPNAYIVPGGRFREIYYWDSYFTMLGLAASNRYDLIESMLNNFKFLIDTYGHIPNGNRSYYLSRSQPPYFALMVELLYKKKGPQVYKKYFSALQKEYNWWMNGEKQLKPGNAFRRVVALADGTVLNRYWDDKIAPREESYYQDVQTGLSYQGNDNNVYTHLRAGAESGWDFSSRWFRDTFSITTIETTEILPVDLNCLLYLYENILSDAAKTAQQQGLSNQYKQRANKRKLALQKYFWDTEHHYYFDYHFIDKKRTGKWTLAGALPLFANIAYLEQANFVRNNLEEKFLKPGGVATSIYHSEQQWDAPNGWAPLQYIVVKGLLNYKYESLAKEIATRWMNINEKVYDNTGKMMEKYNVENTALLSGGGEYPTQDGFGWSNGVYLKFYEMFNSNP